MEQWSIRLGIDGCTVYHSFVYRLDESLCIELEAVRRMRKATRLPFAWEYVVDICHDAQMVASLLKHTPKAGKL